MSLGTNDTWNKWNIWNSGVFAFCFYFSRSKINLKVNMIFCKMNKLWRWSCVNKIIPEVDSLFKITSKLSSVIIRRWSNVIVVWCLDVASALWPCVILFDGFAPENIIHCSRDGLLLSQCRRRWTNIKHIIVYYMETTRVFGDNHIVYRS